MNRGNPPGTYSGISETLPLAEESMSPPVASSIVHIRKAITLIELMRTTFNCAVNGKTMIGYMDDVVCHLRQAERARRREINILVSKLSTQESLDLARNK